MQDNNLVRLGMRWYINIGFIGLIQSYSKGKEMKLHLVNRVSPGVTTMQGSYRIRRSRFSEKICRGDALESLYTSGLE